METIHSYAENFNPRSYKRSDGKTRIAAGIANISIHAPTRGATVKFAVSLTILQISIHAPTRGATNSEHIFYFISDNFNPRSYKRSDCDNAASHCRFKNFNPRSYKRSDSFIKLFFDLGGLFQSTLLQEERQQKCTIFLMHLCNNYCIVSI